MIIAILSLLGVPLWLLIGWLAAGFWHRHENRGLPGVFDFKVRLVSGSYRHVDDSLKGRPGMALWAHDVLICEKGFLVPRNLHFKVAEGVQPPQPADPDDIKHRGDAPVTMQFRLDHGAVIEVAAPGKMTTVAQGPFFVGPIEYSDGEVTVQ